MRYSQQSIQIESAQDVANVKIQITIIEVNTKVVFSQNSEQLTEIELSQIASDRLRHAYGDTSGYRRALKLVVD